MVTPFYGVVTRQPSVPAEIKPAPRLSTERRLPQVIRALLKAGADPVAATSKGKTALHYAAKMCDCSEQQECIAELLAARADVDEETEEGVTPLMIAAQAAHPEAMRSLLAHGARVDD